MPLVEGAMCYKSTTDPEYIYACKYYESENNSQTVSKRCACGTGLKIAEKGDYCDFTGVVGPGCVRDAAKCVPIEGTNNCKVSAACHCGNVTESVAGDICKEFASLNPVNVPKCAGGASANCTSAGAAANCTI